MIQSFKKGGFITALEAGWPILPVTVNFSRQVLPKGSLVFKSGTIEVVVGDPVDTVSFAPDNINGLIEATRETIIRNQTL